MKTTIEPFPVGYDPDKAASDSLRAFMSKKPESLVVEDGPPGELDTKFPSGRLRRVTVADDEEDEEGEEGEDSNEDDNDDEDGEENEEEYEPSRTVKYAGHMPWSP